MLAIPTVRSSFAVLALLVAVSVLPAMAGSALASQGNTSEDRERALKGFSERVKVYAEQKKGLQEGLQKPKTGDGGTGKVERAEDSLAARLQAARRDAKPGNIFGDAASHFRHIIEHDTETRGIRDAYAAMEEVPAQSPPAVNAIYPEKAALATVPPLILVNLPRLPDGLEYRFMGRDLILRDRDANIIVDFVPGAVPAIKK